MLQNYRLIWGLLNQRERRRFILLIVMTICMALFEVLGLAAILPFLSLISDPGLIETNGAIAFFARITGLSDPQEITFAFGVTVLVTLVLGMVVRGLGTYAQMRFALMRGYTISTRLMRLYLSQPYVWFLSQNSSEIGQSILSETDLVVRQCILPGILFTSNLIVLICVTTVVFLAEPMVAIGAAALLAGVYLVVYSVMRGRLHRIGRERVGHNKARFKTVAEVTGGVKEIKVMGLEPVAFNRFSPSALGMARTQTFANIIGSLPRFVLEAVIYGGFISMVLYLMVVLGRDVEELVPILGLLGVASMKLFPALQQMYSQMSLIRFSAPALQNLHRTATTMKAPPPFPETTPLHLTSKLELVDLGYSYPEAETPTLRGLNATIEAATVVGIVGGTGAGKTTMVDIVLGLLEPTSGELRVDGTIVTPERRRDWQRTLGYVPQAIFLLDDTVIANIAFGIPEDKVDMEAVERAARAANLHDFVLSELPDGYQTTVGERGVRLSGGQRQRVGIARALYLDPDVLILDEATSALDNLTEKAVMDAVHNLSGKKTVIMIAHRLSTVRECDKILMLEKGRVSAEGTYEELLEKSQAFNRLASV